MGDLAEGAFAFLAPLWPFAAGLWHGSFAIEAEAACAVDAGALGANLSVLEFFQHLSPGMSVAVVQPAGDHGPARRHSGQELWTSRRDAPVMAYFEQSAGQPRFGQHRLLNWSLGIVFQQNRRHAGRHSRHMGIVVRGFGSGLVVGEGSEQIHARVPRLEGIAGTDQARCK